MSDYKLKRKEILDAAQKGIDELIKVLRDPIIGNSDDSDISADKMKNAAAAKKLAFNDALEMLKRIEDEENLLYENSIDKKDVKEIPSSFAERRAIKSNK